MEKYTDLLTQIGFTPNEAKVYQSLLTIKEASVWNIASHTGIHRRNVYDAVQRLIDKGLAYEIFPKKTLTYAPVHPDKLLELVEDKMAEVKKALPVFRHSFTNVNPTQSIYVYKGSGGLKNYITLILKEGQDIHGIASKGTWFEPRIRQFAVRAGKKLEKSGLKSRLIYDGELKENPDVMKVIGRPYKFLPEKYSSGSSIDIFGDYVAVYSGVNVKELEQDITIFIMRDKTLAQDMLKWWQFMWDHLPEEV